MCRDICRGIHNALLHGCVAGTGVSGPYRDERLSHDGLFNETKHSSITGTDNSELQMKLFPIVVQEEVQIVLITIQGDKGMSPSSRTPPTKPDM